jgi:LPXTG-motif cell wall-anchored protein
LSWPWIFWLYVPISLLAIVVTPRLLPVAARGSIDAAGAAVVAIVRAPETGWGSVQTVVLLAGAVALLGLFVVVQRTRRVPLVRLGLFRTPNLGGANLAQFLLGAAWIPMWYFLNLYLQQVLGYGALASGAALLPNDPRLLTTALTTADNAKPRIKANRISHIMDPARVSACPIAPAMSTSSAMGELTERWRRRASNGEKPRGDGWAMSYTPVPPRG